MNIRVTKKVFEVCPEFSAGMVVLGPIDNRGTHPEIAELLRDIEELVFLTWHKKEGTISADAVKAITHTPSVQGNLKNIVEGLETHRRLVNHDKLTDICTFIALKYMVPVGALNMQPLIPPITYSHSKECITMKDATKKLYDKGVVHSSLRVTSSTKYALIHIEAKEPQIFGIVEELKMLLETFFGKKVRSVIVTKTKPSSEL